MSAEFKIVVQRVFNNWTALKLAVEHGMGGRNGQKTAMEMMEYVYNYCTVNDNISQEELENIIEEILVEEFNTVCEDNSVLEIATILLKSLEYVKSGNINGLKDSYSKMTAKEQWLIPNAMLNINMSDSDTEDESQSKMDVDNEPKEKPITFVEPEEGWTTVRKK